MTDRTPTAFEPMHALAAPARQAMEYWVDGWQRTILFWDVLRQRSTTYYEQRAKPVPHVLTFDAELVLDGRTFDRPANYLLVRIKPPPGVREAAIRSLVYIGMAGPGVDERAFNELRQMGAEHGGITLQEFKQLLREQFFALLLDRNAALAAIPSMLPADTAARGRMLETIRRSVSAADGLGEERAQRTAQIKNKKFFAAASPAGGAARRSAAGARPLRARASRRGGRQAGRRGAKPSETCPRAARPGAMRRVSMSPVVGFSRPGTCEEP
jgi:hypothetical protein